MGAHFQEAYEKSTQTVDVEPAVNAQSATSAPTEPKLEDTADFRLKPVPVRDIHFLICLNY